MNLSKLFEMQKALDDRIVREKGLEGQDLLPNKILALQVELGELANEWRGFKVWSIDREMRRNTALVEYVDCLHFILSIGLDLKMCQSHEYAEEKDDVDNYLDVIETFQELYSWSSELDIKGKSRHAWESFIYHFYALAMQLGFTWDEVEQAYFAKNAVNHERQASGY